jgi:uncharacterized protein
MDRESAERIRNDLRKKIVLLTGPRQVGKTTLSRMLYPRFEYLNFDEAAHRLILKEKSWDRKVPLIIFDELHKMSGWKTYLKGTYDTEGLPPGLLVTGSARLDAFRRVGDSLAGRFFTYRLHPFDARELASTMEPEDVFRRLMSIGGFPEPFLEDNPEYYARWKRTHLDVILRQDLIDLTSIRDIQSVETLIELLRRRVGTPISFASLSRDLQKDPQTIKSWLNLLENLYVIFPVRPHHRNVARSILKEPKYYFFDTGQVMGDDGTRVENAVACGLLKYVDYLADTRGSRASLRYFRTKDGRELDFVLIVDDEVRAGFEVKLSETARSPSFGAFMSHLKDADKVQLVLEPDREKTYPDGVEVRRVSTYMADLDFV